jgi:hypothetical protein
MWAVFENFDRQPRAGGSDEQLIKSILTNDFDRVAEMIADSVLSSVYSRDFQQKARLMARIGQRFVELANSQLEPPQQ